MSLLTKIIGTYSEREIKKIKHLVEEVNQFEEAYKNLSEAELKGKTAVFKERLAQGETLDDILPEAFATVREASWRVLGMRHFNVQILGGIVLHQGRISEMKTGEGKTLVATLPVYLNALSGKGVHVVTVNDYLATRDSEWMGKIYRYLGLSVGLIIHDLSNEERKEAYNSDITYGTNNEYGFDYLRDNMVSHLDNQVQRDLNFAIVDEVDSILIDEARTPLIISGKGDDSSELYGQSDQFVRGLKKTVVTEADLKEDIDEIQSDADYVVDEKAKTAVLTKNGVSKAERFFRVDNLSDSDNYEINHHINNALKAHGTMHRDQSYVVKDGEVIIVDDFTGRLMEGRRYSNGLHQAIEAKEHVAVNRESKTLATITFQNFFRLYSKLSGMTGTALTEEEEFRAIYKLDVITIPTNQNVVRIDEADAIYKTERGKLNALLKEVKEVNKKGQPMLIGTVSVEHSEQISALFNKNGIKHNVLNAKFHAREAEIVAQAGRYGAVTIATNMAGRGTDILLGGNPEYLSKQTMRQQGFEEDLIDASTAHNETDDENILRAREAFQKLEKEFSNKIKDEKEKVVAAGGLYILGTERHESRRIDNQLRGRSGRQGDPGKSKFYLSLEDDLMRLFGGERMNRWFTTFKVDEDTEIQSRALSGLIEQAQGRVEGKNFNIRKNVLQYDNVMNLQREVIYTQRKKVLQGEDLHTYYEKIIEDLMTETLLDFVAEEPNSREWDKVGIDAQIKDVFGYLPSLDLLKNDKEILEGEAFNKLLCEEALDKLEYRKVELGSEEILKDAERFILLQTVDNHWMEHIDAMDDLRNSIGMRSYGQHDPLIEYQREGELMFEEMNRGIREDAIRLIMRAKLTVENQAQKKGPARQLTERRGQELNAQGAPAQGPGEEKSKGEPVKRNITVGRNDPCWCGSGKKYKNCHYQSDQEG